MNDIAEKKIPLERFKSKVLFALSIMVPMGFFLWFVWRGVDVSGVFKAMALIRPWAVAGGLLVLLVCFWLNAYRWKLCIQLFDTRSSIGVLELMKVLVISNFFGFIIPVAVTVDAANIILSRKHFSSYRGSIYSVSLSRIYGLGSLLILSLLCWLVSYGCVGGGGALVIILVLFLGMPRMMKTKFVRGVVYAKSSTLSKILFQTNRGGTYSWLMCVSLLSQGLFATSFAILLWEYVNLGQVFQVFTYFLLSQLLGSIPAVFNIGPIQVVQTEATVMMGLSQDLSAAMALSHWCIYHVYTIVGGGLYLWRRLSGYR